MNRSKLIRLAAATAGALLCSQAFADSGTLSVSASVAAVCKLQTVPAMAFTLDPSTNTNGSATSGVTYKCTKNTAPATFTVGGSGAGTGYSGTLAGTAAGNTGTTIAYSISWAAPTTAGNGFGAGSTATTVTLTGAVPAANFSNVPADTYTGSVAIAITP
jgi:spore coat protein U-like protein